MNMKTPDINTELFKLKEHIIELEERLKLEKNKNDFLNKKFVKYYNIFQKSQNPVLLINPDTLELIEMNQSGLLFFSSSRENILYKTITDLFEHDRAYFSDLFNFSENSITKNVELFYFDALGAKRTVETQVSKFSHGSSTLIFLFILAPEYSTSQVSSLIDSKQIYNALNEIVYICDAENKLIFCNEQFLKLCNKSKISDVINQDKYLVFPISSDYDYNDYRNDDLKVKELQSGEEIVKREAFYSDSLGLRSLNSKKFPVFNEVGEFSGICTISEDITAGIKADALHKERINRLNKQKSALITITQTGMILKENYQKQFESITSIASKSMDVERASIWIYNDDKSELVCVDLYDSVKKEHSTGHILHVVDFPIYFHALGLNLTITANDVYRDHRTSEFIAEYFSKFNIRSMLDAPIRQGGQLSGVLCLEHTNTFRKWENDEEFFASSLADFVSLTMDKIQVGKLQSNLIESESKLHELDSTKNKFLSIISHDLKNNFNTLINYSDKLESLVKTGAMNEIGENASILKESIYNSYKLLSNMLYWARTKSGSLIPNIEELDVWEIVSEIIYEFQNEAKLKKILLINEVKQNLTASADRNMLMIILRNVVSNALKFTPDRGVVQFSAMPNYYDGKDRIEINVTDTGIGMSEEVKQALFTNSSEVITPGLRNEAGSGFGLIICRDLLEKMAGTIKISGEKWKGTIVGVTLNR